VEGPVLTTERLTLRPPSLEDFDAWAAFAADEEVMRTLGGVQPRSVAWRGIAGVAGSWALQDFGMFSVVDRASGRWLGRVGPLWLEGWPGTEIGWGLVREAWGKGIATEAAAACMDFAVDQLGWTDIVHCIESDNTASQNVARRLGSTVLRAGRLPPPNELDLDIWGQSAAQWRENRRAVRGLTLGA
jgi:RimJ/RimL family protein N-acetyltransferase